MTFAVCLLLDGSIKAELLIDSVIQSAYQAFKSQVILASQFRKGLGQRSVNDLKKIFDGASQDALSIDEEIIQSQLQFLRTATACKLIATAVNRSFKPQNCSTIEMSTADNAWTFQPAQESTFMVDETKQGESATKEKFDIHLGLNLEFIKLIRIQVDDTQEFTLLTQYLGVDTSLTSVHSQPETLK
jgi:hypothetical protein